MKDIMKILRKLFYSYQKLNNLYDEFSIDNKDKINLSIKKLEEINFIRKLKEDYFSMTLDGKIFFYRQEKDLLLQTNKI